MGRYEVHSVVCDYGVFKDGELIPELILNSRANTLLIAEILDFDQDHIIHPRAKHGTFNRLRECSNCGKTPLDVVERSWGLVILPPYCPWCGAKMEGLSDND